MNPGPVEEASKIAQTTIAALNSVPVLLALVLLQFVIIGAIVYVNTQRDANIHERFTKLIDGCLSLQKDLGRKSSLTGPPDIKSVMEVPK